MSAKEKSNRNTHACMCLLYANSACVCMYVLLPWKTVILLALVRVGSLWVSASSVTPRNALLAQVPFSSVRPSPALLHPERRWYRQEPKQKAAVSGFSILKWVRLDPFLLPFLSLSQLTCCPGFSSYSVEIVLALALCCISFRSFQNRGSYRNKFSLSHFSQ